MRCRRPAACALATLLAAAIAAPPAAADIFGPLDPPTLQTTYSDEVMADGPVAYWRLGEASGTTMVDAVGANTGSYSGGVTLGAPGALPYDPDTAATFDGNSGRASAPDSDSLDRTGAVTVEAWVKRTKSGQYQVIVGKPGNGQSKFENYSLWFNTSNRVQSFFGNGSTYVTATSEVLDTGWHHIAAAYDEATTRLYVDGALSAQKTSTVALTPNPFPINVGRADWAQYFFGGTLDEVAVYPTALSAARIQAHHAKSIADVTPPSITVAQPASGSSTSSVTPAVSGTAGTASGDLASVTVRIYEGVGTGGALVQSLVASRDVSGAYAVVASPALAEGTYTARAEQSDSAGNTGFSSANTFTVDTTAPAVSITSGPADPTSATSAAVAFSSEAGATFECKLDGGSYSACTSPKNYSALSDGGHTVSVRASDNAGNTGSPATHSWTIDTTAPAVSITSGPADPTSATSAAVAFSSEAGATFECKLDGGSYSACTSPKNYSALSDGGHTVSVRASDNAGNTGSPATHSWTIDTTAPAVSITSGPADPTSATSAAVAFSSEAGATFECKLDGGSYSACTSPKNYSALSDGGHTVSVRASDNAGNTGSPATHSWTIDTTAPAVSITSGPADPTSATSAAVAFSSEAGATFECKLDGGSYSACTSPKNYSALSDGGHTVSVRASDNAGNTGSPATHSWTIDTTAPAVSITSGPADPTSATSAAVAFSSEAGATFECKLDGGSYSACTSPKNYSALSDGGHTVSVRASDNAGNTGSPATHSWTIDTTAPVLTITSPADGSTTGDTTPSLAGVAGTAIGDDTAVTIRVYTGSTATGSPIQTLNTTRGAGGVYGTDAATLANGTYTAQAEQSDDVGNSALSNTTTFTVDPGAADVTPPTVSLSAPLDGGVLNSPNPSFLGVAGVEAGDSSTVTVRVYLGSTIFDPLVQSLVASRDVSGAYAVVASPALAEGTYTARAEQSDSAGNTGFSSANTFTVDTTAPAVSITSGPADPTSATSAAVAFSSEAGATFECKLDGGSYSACTSPKNYSALSDGGHTVSVRASDNAGNTGSPATHSWTIDTTAPAVSITSGPADPTSATSAAVAFSSEAGATFECKLDGGSYSACTSPKNYSALSDGGHTVSVRASDNAGNTGSPATHSWTIDTTAPAVSITSGPADPTSATSAAVAFSSEAGATFECKLDGGSYSACTSPKNYSALSDGGHTVSVRASDNAGNTGSPATHSWTIDTTAPVLTITSPADGSTTGDTTPSLAGVAGTAIGDDTAVTIRVYTGSTATGSPIQTLNTTRGAGGVYGTDAATLANGTYTAKASQSDAAGNNGQSGTTTFTVDTVAPVITLTSPADGSSPSTSTPAFSGVAGAAAGDSTTATVRIYSGSTATGSPLQSLTATRGGGGAYSVNSAALGQGTYTARAEQADAAGNTGLSSANTFTISTADPVLIGAGDIAGCGSGDGRHQTAALLAQFPTATVFTLGDNAYPNGQPSEYANCYGPSWGVHKARTRPITGGHDTATVGGGALPNQGFSDYFSAQLAPFGATATDRLKSYYSYDIGAWHVVMLNSACYYDLPGCNTALQEQWLRDDLAANQSVCTAVMWHDSRWSSGEIHGDQDFTQPFWQIAYDAGADIVLGGNEHDYERFAPQDANGAIDNQYGIRSFVVGTGGYYLYGLGSLKPNSQAYSSTYGVMKLTLHPTSYDWQFLPVAGETFTDSGTGNCHDKPGVVTGTPTVRSTAAKTANHPSTSLTIDKPAGTQSGDVLLATIGYQSGSIRNLAPPSGWTAVPNTHVFEGTNAGMRAFYKIAGGSEPSSYTFQLTGGSGQALGGGIMAIIGADTAAPIDAAGGLNNGSSNVTLLTAPSITTTKPKTLLVYSGAVNQGPAFTPPQLMPEQWDVKTTGTYNIGTTAAAGGLAAAGPTGTRASTMSWTARGVAISIAIAPQP